MLPATGQLWAAPNHAMPITQSYDRWRRTCVVCCDGSLLTKSRGVRHQLRARSAATRPTESQRLTAPFTLLLNQREWDSVPKQSEDTTRRPAEASDRTRGHTGPAPTRARH